MSVVCIDDVRARRPERCGRDSVPRLDVHTAVNEVFEAGTVMLRTILVTDWRDPWVGPSPVHQRVVAGDRAVGNLIHRVAAPQPHHVQHDPADLPDIDCRIYPLWTGKAGGGLRERLHAIHKV